MPSGILGQSAPSATTNTTVYTVPAGKTATFNINVVNRGTSVVSVRIAIAADANPATAEWIEYGAAVPSGGVLERTGIVAEATRRVVVHTSSADASINVYGHEE
jgi:hypothetical protein